MEAERIDVDIDVNFRELETKIVGVRLSSLSVEAGSRVSVYVTTRAYGEQPVTRVFPLTIPSSLSGSVLNLEVAGGSRVSPVRATPTNLEQLIKNATTLYSGRSLIISLYTPSQGITVSGRVINDIPGSIFDSLNTGSQKTDESSFRAVSRSVFPAKRIVEGRMHLRLRVRDENE